MRVLRSFGGSIVMLVFAACASGLEPDAPGPLPVAADLNNGVGVVIQVSGAGAVDLTSAGAGLAEFQFVAERRADGTVWGHFWQKRSRATGTVDFAGVVTCLTTDPNFPGRARIGGVITENNSTDPAFLTSNHDVGDDVWFRVQDGGNGGDADDRSTTYGFVPTLVGSSAAYCALPFDGLPAWNPASIFPLARGTIHVRG